MRSSVSESLSWSTAMTLAFMSRGATMLHNLAGLRWAYDFDDPGLSRRAQLERMRHAIVAARRVNLDQRLDVELEYALRDCEALLQLSSLEGEEAERKAVETRMARTRRILAYHEGTLSRLNRRYWWVPFSLMLCFLVYVCACDLAARLSLFVP